MIKIHISFPLITGILKTDFDEECLLNAKKRLEAYLKKNDVLNQIEKATGFTYKKVINIWLINGSYESSPNPNLLNIGEKMIFDLYCLITHNILLENNFYDHYFTNYGIAESTLESTVYYIASKFVQIDKSNKLEKYIWDIVEELNFSDEPIKKQVEKIKFYLEN